MSRLWKCAAAIGLVAVVTLTDSLRFSRSAWPAVALFVVAAIVAVIAAAVDGLEKERAADEQGDAAKGLEEHRASTAKELATIAEVVNQHGADIDYLKKRGVYGDTLGG